MLWDRPGQAVRAQVASLHADVLFDAQKPGEPGQREALATTESKEQGSQVEVFGPS